MRSLLEAAVRERITSFERARSNDDRAVLVAWISDIATTYGDVPALRDMLDNLSVDLGVVVASDMRAALDRRFPEPANPSHGLDEIDARIDAFVVRLAERDPLTSEHSRAVAAWCARLARRLGLDGVETVFASRCGLLHDVGKTLTPPEVLHAPRALDEREWRLMRAHAAAGEALVMREPELRVFAPAVRSHHERIDGGGYPDGLRGAAIPFIARLVAVADSFNAMIGRRPYRLPLSPVKALDELLRGRGRQFDPEIVDAMIDVVMG